MGTVDHKHRAPPSITLAVLSVSSTRTLETDDSGKWIARQGRREGHEVVDHRVVDDDAPAIAAAVREILEGCRPQALLVTGGTGLGPRDVTIEALKPLFHKELTAFGPLFAQLSFEEIDSAALLSRAAAGLIATTVVFCMPGSLKACKLACKALIFPELGHIVGHVFTN
jgi:molybdenum cofactor biosynthesis protein B